MRSQETSTLELYASLTDADRQLLIQEAARKHNLSPSKLKAVLLRSWSFTGRPKQQAPEGEWTFWYLLAGRGFGKTLSAAQWAKKKGLEGRVRFALVAPTFADVRDTMVEGETGLLSVLPNDALLGQSRDIAWNRSMGELTLANGTTYRAFSSVEPSRLRGPQHHYAWGEEVSSWKDASKGDAQETTWSNLKLGTRLGDTPQFVLTSTPKVNKLTRELVEKAKTDPVAMRIVRGSSYENRSNLSEAWWKEVVAPLEGTRTGRQEIMAELLEDVEGALWNRSTIDAVRIRPELVPPLGRIVVAVDPNASNDEAANSAGIIVVGRSVNVPRLGYVLDDRTITRGGPRAWAAASVLAYDDWKADRIVAEKNNGGEMVRLTIETVDSTVPITLVNASRGKRTRAEPVSSLYEGQEGWQESPHLNAPKVRHAGIFPDLEDEMTTWTPESESPDRMDALVWGLSELMLGVGSGRYKSSVARGRIQTSATDRRAAG